MYSGRRAAQALAQLAGGRRPALGGHHVGDQPPVARPPAAPSRATTTASRTAGLGGQRRLDLAQLDAEAADLHLVVDAAQELDRAVRQPAREVAGAVEPRPRARAENGSGTKRSAVSSGRPR